MLSEMCNQIRYLVLIVLPSNEGLRCSHTQSTDIDEDSDEHVDV